MKVGIILDTAIGSIGIKKYSLNLVKGLSKNGIDNLKVFYTTELNELSEIENIELIKLKQPFNNSLGIGYRQVFQLPKILKKQDLDVIHDTYSFGPFLRPIKNTKSLIVVHDIAPYLYNYNLHYNNSTLSKAFTKFRYEILLPKILKNVDRIIAMSNNTKKDLIEHFEITPSKIDVVYHGIEHNLFKTHSKNKINEIKNKYDINDNTIIIGSFNSDRRIDNINELLEALSILTRTYPEIKLLLMGKSNENVDNLIKSLKLGDYIIKTGYVPDYELPLLYNLMDLFLFLSDYEGFGFPPLEAMACGTPVIALNRSSMPEITGDAGMLINKKEPSYIAEKVSYLIQDTDLRKSLKVKGIRQSKNYNWENTINSTLEVYNTLI
jgi:glycosyltransferase involved in cell wall biosynthesis